MIEHQQFVMIWQKSKTLNDFLQATSIDRRQATNTAYYLRKKGVALKYFPRQRKDWSEMIELGHTTLKESAKKT